METVELISLMLGASWASGINLYAAILVLGWLGGSGDVNLPPAMEVLSDPRVMMAAGAMYCIEFLADKIPGVDSGWDLIHTFIRIPAGALMAAAAAQGLELGQAGALVALLLGGGVASVSHATKAGTQALINTSPEPVSNWSASITEDLSVVAGLWAALHHPWIFLVALSLFIVVVAWLLPRIWRALKGIVRGIGRWFGAKEPVSPAPPGRPADRATIDPDTQQLREKREGAIK